MRRDDLCHQVRQSLKRLPDPFGAHYGVIPPAPPEEGIPFTEATKQLEAAHIALAKVDTIASQMKDPYLVSRILTRREAVSSSSIEGTNSTLDEILSVEEVDESGGPAAKQVRNYALALEEFIPRAEKLRYGIFTIELIQSLHRAVMKDDSDYKDVPGELRSRVVWIGGGKEIAYSTWNPPPPEDIKACLLQTVDYLRNEGMQSMTQGLITRMAISHAHFEAVHPFRDGNGRVGRLLLPLMMVAEGRVPLYLSPYLEVNKTKYYQSLKEAQQKLKWESFVGFIADAIVGTVDELLVTRQALTNLSEAWKERRKFRKGSAALNALSVLPHYPVVTTKRLGNILGVSAPQATQAIAQLVEAGILIERTGYSRNRIYAANEALSIINRPFGEEPIVYDEPDGPRIGP